MTLAMNPIATVSLKPNADYRLRAFYPWGYRADIERVDGEPQPGDIVSVHDARGAFVAQGFYNAQSHIPLRFLSYETGLIDANFFRERIRAAIRRRDGRISGTNAWRVVNSESDQLPGMILDRFADVLVVQLRNAGMERHREILTAILAEELQPRGIAERSDVEVRADEGLEERAGTLWGEVPDTLEIAEDDVTFSISLAQGQKTGFYLDQRDNRRRLRAYVQPGDRVLDVYSYVGSFGLHAARAGASVLCVDKDAAALALAEQAARRNGLWPQVGVRWGDAIEVLRALVAEGRTFTHLVLDPPTLVKRKEDLPRIKRLFVEMCTHALALLEPGGILLLSSCAFYIGASELLEVARAAAGDPATATNNKGAKGARGRRIEVLDVTYQPADHPWILQVPETLYLKSVFMRVE
jgi:23S rRNA (cytosine1962-C5)-methyltransferase